MRLMPPALRKLASERGQAIIMFVGLATIIAMVAAITIDFGLWFSERRGAQTDADLVSLAGAYELLANTATFADVDGATQDSALANGLDPVEDLHDLEVKSLAFPEDSSDLDPNFCHEASDTGGRLNAVVLDVDHDSAALFVSIFGLDAPDIGAHACARAGSLRRATGLRPWTVPALHSDCFEDGVPLFLENCIFRFADDPSQVGSIRLGDDPGDECNEPGGGADQYQENIVEGSDAVCEIGDLIDTEPGGDTGPTLTAIKDLLATEGECDALNGDGNGIDEFEESFQASSDSPGPDVTFVARDCVTPRAIHIVIVEEFDGTGFDTVPILGFAAFFLEGCERLDGPGGEPLPLPDGFLPKCDFGGGPFFFQVRGFFMSILELGGDIGAFDEFGTKGIILAE